MVRDACVGPKQRTGKDQQRRYFSRTIDIETTTGEKLEELHKDELAKIIVGLKMAMDV